MRNTWKQIMVAALVGTMAGAPAMPALAAGAGTESGETPALSRSSDNDVESGPGFREAGQQEQEAAAPANVDVEVRDGITFRTAHFTGIDAYYRMGKGDEITNIGLALQGLDGDVSYSACVNNGGWQPWTLSGAVSGGTEDSTYLEGVRIMPRAELQKGYDVYYACIMSGSGKLGYAKNGEMAGAPGRGEHVVGLDIVILPKGTQVPPNEQPAYVSMYQERITSENGALLYADPDGSSYEGWLEEGDYRYYVKDRQLLTGWQYIDGLKYYFGEDGRLVEDLDSILGRQPSYQIRINKQMNHCTVYAKDGDNGYIIPVKAMLTSVGDDTPLGTFKTPEKYRWRLMVNGAYTQYATRIKPGAGFLLHSVIFDKENNHTLWTDTFNQLGVLRSLGCVRITTGNSKWIYDNCPIGTEIVIYNGDDVSPLPVPAQIPIPQDQNWDPTDPLA